MTMNSSKALISIFNQTQQSVVCSSVLLADTFRTRLFGLLGKRVLAEDSGLLLKPCAGVHTFGMTFAIDIVSLDKRDRVIGIFEQTGPWRLRGLSVTTRSVLELPAGAARRTGLVLGDQLEVHARA